MIARNDQSWQTADIQLPELARLFDNDSIAELLGLRAGALASDYIRYKPGTSALVRLVGVDEPRTPLGYAKTFALEDAAKLHASALKCPTDGSSPPIPFGRCSILFPLPADHRLRALWRCGTTAGRVRIGRRLDLDPESYSTMNLLAYKPEKRCVFRARTINDDEVVVKFMGGSRWAAAKAQARLAQSVVQVPTLRSSSRRYNALVYDFSAGVGLREHLNQSTDVDALRACGAALGLVHQSSLYGSSGAQKLPRLNRLQELQALDATAELLAALMRLVSVEDEERVIAVHSRLYEWLRNEPLNPVVCHGDFYDKQILLGSRGVTLLDFDDACVGDGRMDVANFVAHRLRHGEANGQQTLSALLEGYPDSSRWLMNNISGYVAVRLFLLSHHPFRALQPDWLSATRRLLDLCWQWHQESQYEN